MILLAPAPGLLVEPLFDRGSLVRIALAPAPQFFCRLPPEMESHPLLDWLYAYAEGKLSPFPISLDGFTPFFQKALRAIEKIPFGQTLSYQEIAAAIGSPKAARAIGGACQRNPFPLVIPCHRVVGRGNLGGYTPGLGLKTNLLDFERSTTGLSSTRLLQQPSPRQPSGRDLFPAHRDL